MMKEWKINQTVFIDKVDKEKIRPIILGSCMSKILERMVNERLLWWAENRGILEKWQNGFRRGRFCIDNLAKVKMEVEMAGLTGEKIAIAFLDVNSAYDDITVNL